MTADDRRYTLRQAADLTGKSVDTLRRLCKDGELPGDELVPAADYVVTRAESIDAPAARVWP